MHWIDAIILLCCLAPLVCRMIRRKKRKTRGCTGQCSMCSPGKQAACLDNPDGSGYTK